MTAAAQRAADQSGIRRVPLRLEFVDSVRALAALYVLVAHAFYEPQNGYYASRVLNHLGLTYGHLAVVVFIVVSGFCLMLPVARRGDDLGSLRAFYWRRVRRICPPYYAALALSALFIVFVAHEPTGTAWDASLPLTWPTVWKHVLLVHNLPIPGRGGGINHPFWSIAVESQIYLLMPLIVWSLRRFHVVVPIVGALALGLLVPHHPGAATRGITAWFVPCFVFGAIAARASVRAGLEARSWWRPAGWALGLGVGAVIVATGHGFYTRFEAYFDVVAGAATALILAATLCDASDRRYAITRVLSWKPLATVGLFSYSIYLVHAPLLHACWLILRPLLHPRPAVMFALLLLLCPAIVAAAYGFHRLFERPFMNTPRGDSPATQRAAA